MAYKVVLNPFDGSLQLVTASISPSNGNITNSFVAGQSFAANTSYVVRWGIQSNGENPTQIYVADDNISTLNNFWAIGFALSTSAVGIGGSIKVYSFGPYTLGSNDTPFSSTDIGNVVWINTNGSFSTTPPNNDSLVDQKLGIVMALTQIWVSVELMGLG